MGVYSGLTMPSVLILLLFVSFATSSPILSRLTPEKNNLTEIEAKNFDKSVNSYKTFMSGKQHLIEEKADSLNDEMKEMEMELNKKLYLLEQQMKDKLKLEEELREEIKDSARGIIQKMNIKADTQSHQQQSTKEKDLTKEIISDENIVNPWSFFGEKPTGLAM